MKHLIIILLLLAGHASAQVIETNWETGVIWIPVKDAATHEMIRASLRESDPLIRVQGLAIVATIRDPADIALVRPLLNDSRPAVRAEALKTLTALEQAVPATLPAQTNETMAVVHSIAHASADEIRKHLQDPVVLIQQAAVDAAARQKLEALAPALVPLLDSPDSVLRRHVCEALGTIRVDQSKALATQLGRDDDPFVRRAAAEAMLAIHTDAARDELITLLKHERAPVRMESAMALARWGQPAVAQSLHALLGDREPLVARAAADALGKLGNPESQRLLLDYLPKTDPHVQTGIAWALGEFRYAEAVPALSPLLKSGHLLLESAVAEAFGKIGDQQVVPELRKVLVEMKAHGAPTRTSALEALRRLGDRDSSKRAMQLLTEKVVPPPPNSTEWMYDMDEVRAEALRYFEFIGDPKRVDEFMGKLKDMPTYQLRKAFAETITKLTGQPHMAALTVDTRHYLMESLGGEDYPKSPPIPGIIPTP